VSGRGPGAAGRYAYGGEGDLERWLTKWIHDLREALPGRLYAYHTHRSDRSAAGFPDWVFAGPGGVIYRELKGDRGKLRPGQLEAFAMLKTAGADVGIWRPADRMSGRIQAELRRIAGLGIAGRDNRGRDHDG
jgi:hypothetical protein